MCAKIYFQNFQLRKTFFFAFLCCISLGLITREISAQQQTNSDLKTLRLVHLEGMQQAYQLGQFLRKLYLESGFMDLSYNRSQIYVRSTNRDRTLMTAYSVLAGLYPPNGSQIWNEAFPWQPIPVHTVPMKEDYLLRDDATCPKSDKLIQEFRNTSEELKQFIINNQDLIKFIHNKTKEPANAKGLFRVLDPVICERAHEKDMNLILPDWIKNDTIYKRLKDVHNFVSKIRFPTLEIRRLRGGTLVKTLIEHIDNLTKGDPDIKKMYMYSAHDTTVNMVMRALGIFNNVTPPYTACLIIELHEPLPGSYDLRILYRNETSTEKLYNITIPGCNNWKCPLDKFKSLVKNVIPGDIRKECVVNDDPPQHSTNSKSSDMVIGIAVLGCLVGLLLIIIVAIVVIFRKQQRYYSYRPLPIDAM